MRDRSRPSPPLLALAAQVPLPPSPKPFSRYFTSVKFSRQPQDVPLPPSPALLAFPSSDSSSSASSSVDYRLHCNDERNYPPSHFSPPSSPEPRLTALCRRLTSLSFNPRSSASTANASAWPLNDPGAALPVEQHRISGPLLHQEERPPLSPSAFSFNSPRTRPPLPPSPLFTSCAPSPQRAQPPANHKKRKAFWNGRLGAGGHQQPRTLAETFTGLMKRATSRVGRKGEGAVSKSGSLGLASESMRWTREVNVEQASQLREGVKGLLGADPVDPWRTGPQSDWLHGSSSADMYPALSVKSSTSPKAALSSTRSRLRHHTCAPLFSTTDSSARPCCPIRRAPAALLPRPSLGASFEMAKFGPLFDNQDSDRNRDPRARRSVRQVASATLVLQHNENRQTSRRSLSSPSLSSPSLRLAPTSSALDLPSLPDYYNSPGPRRRLDPELSHSLIEHDTRAHVDGGWDTGTPTKRRQAGELDSDTIRIRIIEPTPPWLKNLKDEKNKQGMDFALPKMQELKKDGARRGAGGAKLETSFGLHRHTSELRLSQKEQSNGASPAFSVKFKEEEDLEATESPLRHRSRPSTSLSDLSNFANARHFHPLPLPPFAPPPCPPQRHPSAAVDKVHNQNASLPPRLNRRVRLDASPYQSTLVVRIASHSDESECDSERDGSPNHELEQRVIIDEMDRLLEEMGGISDEEVGDEVVWEESRFEDAEEDEVSNDEGCERVADRSLQSLAFGHGFSAFLASTSTSKIPSLEPSEEQICFAESTPDPFSTVDHRQSRLASRRGRAPLPPLDLPPREVANVEVAPSGYHSEESEGREQVGSWAFEEQNESQEWTPTPESEEKTPHLASLTFPTFTPFSDDLVTSHPTLPTSSTPRRLTTLSVVSSSASFPSPSSTYSTSSPPTAHPRPRTLSTPSLLLGPFSPSARHFDAPNSHYFSPPKVSPSLAQSPGSVLVSSGGPESEDWRLSPVLVGGRETLRRLGSERD